MALPKKMCFQKYHSAYCFGFFGVSTKIFGLMQLERSLKIIPSARSIGINALCHI